MCCCRSNNVSFDTRQILCNFCDALFKIVYRSGVISYAENAMWSSTVDDAPIWNTAMRQRIPASPVKAFINNFQNNNAV